VIEPDGGLAPQIVPNSTTTGADTDSRFDWLGLLPRPRTQESQRPPKLARMLSTGQALMRARAAEGHQALDSSRIGVAAFADSGRSG
jgi:hypothetical protein